MKSKEKGIDFLKRKCYNVRYKYGVVTAAVTKPTKNHHQLCTILLEGNLMSFRMLFAQSTRGAGVGEGFKFLLLLGFALALLFWAGYL